MEDVLLDRGRKREQKKQMAEDQLLEHRKKRGTAMAVEASQGLGGKKKQMLLNS